MTGCPSVTTGAQFLAETLNHLDCQAQTLGSFGFQSLAAFGSPASLALTGLLTLFIALFAVRLLLGHAVTARDAVDSILKIGIALTLAASWPAFRIIAYDTVLLAPAEIASSLTPSSLPDTSANFAQRLQNIDTGIASLTLAGSGRQTGSLELEQRRNDAFRTIAMGDETAFGWARTIYLSAVIGSLAILRVGGGLLLAVAPLFAGLLLFDFARGLFAGWVRGLVLVALGSLGMTLLLAVEVAVMEPWLTDALQRRSLGYAIPTAPTELLALSLAFAIASAGLLILLGRIAFQNGWSMKVEHRNAHKFDLRETSAPSEVGLRTDLAGHARASTISEGVRNLIRHEEARSGLPQALMIPAIGEPNRVPHSRAVDVSIGSAWGRTSRRTTAAQTERDTRS